MLQCVAVDLYCGVTVCCSLLISSRHRGILRCNAVLQCVVGVAVCVAVCCSVLQFVDIELA